MSDTATKKLKRRLPRSLKAKKETAPKAPEPEIQSEAKEEVVEPVEPVDSSSESSCDADLSTRLDNAIKELNENLKLIKNNINTLKTLKKEVRSYETKIKRLTKKKTKKGSDTKKPNGFAKPVEISEQLSTFLKTHFVKILNTPEQILDSDAPKIVEKKEKINEENVVLLEKIKVFIPKSSENKMARTDITKLLTRYIKYNNLQNPEKKTNILIKSKQGIQLGKLLSGKEDSVDLTFMNMQKYISHHFKKKTDT